MNQILKVDRRTFLVAALSTSGAFVVGTQGAVAASGTMSRGTRIRLTRRAPPNSRRG